MFDKIQIMKKSWLIGSKKSVLGSKNLSLCCFFYFVMNLNKATILGQVEESYSLTLCCYNYFIMRLNISVIPTELESWGKYRSRILDSLSLLQLSTIILLCFFRVLCCKSKILWKGNQSNEVFGPWSLREVIFGKSQRIIEEQDFLGLLLFAFFSPYLRKFLLES